MMDSGEGYEVKLVGEDELPEGVDWAMLAVDGAAYFVVKRSKACLRILEQGPRAFQMLTHEPVRT